MHRKKSLLLLLSFIILLASACTAQITPTANQLPVVATTSILADVVSRVGGNLVSVTTLVPPGVNEHEYQPSPRDIAAVSDAALVFEVGLGLEQFMDAIIRNASDDITPIEVSSGISAQELLIPHDANTAEQQH